MEDDTILFIWSNKMVIIIIFFIITAYYIQRALIFSSESWYTCSSK